MKRSTHVFAVGLISFFILLALIVWGGWWWVMKRPIPMQTNTVDYIVKSGMGPRQIARNMAQAGIAVDEDSFALLARYTEADKQLQAGAYQAQQGDSMWSLLQRMVKGNMLQTKITFVEGWTFHQVMQKITEHPHIEQTLDQQSVHEIIEKLNLDKTHPEGLFHPDTYIFTPGTTDLQLLKRAYQAQLNLINQLWPKRAENLPLKDPYEALILASIVEKETGRAEDRKRIAGVFINRLNKGMLLQTDPTVIYGMGEKYQGRIRKIDLTTDNPWNTYTRPGLPPTPIALPSKASIDAVLHPETHSYYYFVARGDGSSEFSKSLNEHNRAVAKYILKRN